MPPLDLTSIPLPDLGDATRYPVVDHAPLCTDTWSPTRACLATPLHRVRPYALPTEPLATLKFPWARRNLFNVPAVPLIPPSLGTLCPAIDITPAVVGTGDSAVFGVTIEKTAGDACRPVLVPVITFPCTQLEPGIKTITMDPGGTTPSWAQTMDNVSNPTSCIGSINDIMSIPCSAVTVDPITSVFSGLSGGLALTATQSGCNTLISGILTLSTSGATGSGSAGFVVGTTANHGAPDQSDTCVTTYPPNAVVPVYDKFGIFGPAGTQLDATANTYTNKSNATLTDGDPIFLTPFVTPGQWGVFQ